LCDPAVLFAVENLMGTLTGHAALSHNARDLRIPRSAAEFAIASSGAGFAWRGSAAGSGSRLRDFTAGWHV
jgi:hypothetical protein